MHNTSIHSMAEKEEKLAILTIIVVLLSCLISLSVPAEYCKSNHSVIQYFLAVTSFQITFLVTPAYKHFRPLLSLISFISLRFCFFNKIHCVLRSDLFIRCFWQELKRILVQRIIMWLKSFWCSVSSWKLVVFGPTSLPSSNGILSVF